MRMITTRERTTASLAEQAAFDEAMAIYLRKVADIQRKRLGADLLLLLACVLLASCAVAAPLLRFALLPMAFAIAWAGIHLRDRMMRARAILRW